MLPASTDPCSTCDGKEHIRLEAQVGAPGSGGYITCPDCGPPIVKHVDADDLPSGVPAEQPLRCDLTQDDDILGHIWCELPDGHDGGHHWRTGDAPTGPSVAEPLVADPPVQTDTAVIELNARGKFRASVGIPVAAKLAAWAGMVRSVYTDVDVLVTGSALESKDWHDIDVYIAFPSRASYAKAFPSGTPADVIGGSWDVLSAAWSALAREMTGVNVEARLMARPSEWLDGALPLAAADLPVPEEMLAAESEAAEAGRDVEAPMVRNRTHIAAPVCPECGSAHYGVAADCPTPIGD